MPIRSIIIEQFFKVAESQEKELTNFSDTSVLNDTGLDSLCFAIIVARLEDLLGVDPFRTAEEVLFPTTLGEFIALYERMAK